MKTLALIALAGAASTATAQDMIITVCEVTPGNWDITAEFFGSLPVDTTALGTVLSDASFRVSGDSAINFGDGWNPSFVSSLFGPPTITNDGTTSVDWLGFSPAAPIGNPDNSNPLFIDNFTYTWSGDNDSLDLELVGQNSALFTGNPAEPFGTILQYQDAQGNPGVLSFDVVIKPIPAPASAALLGLGGLAAARRRR